MKTIINIFHSDDSNESNNSNGTISMKEVQMKKIKCINLYLKNKQIARNRKI